MDVSGACKYCGASFEGLKYHPRRVTCGGYECKLKYAKAYSETVSSRLLAGESVGSVSVGSGASRTWGSFAIPSKQDKLNEAMIGQVMHCPNCGDVMVVQVDQHQKCQKCGALWTVSWGTKKNGDVAVARLDRWS